MIYKAIGIMSGSSLDGLDLACVQFEERGGTWQFEVLQASCEPFEVEIKNRLSQATKLSAKDYLLLDVDFGHYIGSAVNTFIEKYQLDFQVQLVASHGHTTFHMPSQRMTAQLGHGAAIAAATGIHTVTDLRAMDVALGGQGAPIVPIGEKALWPQYKLFLNIGGIANVSAQLSDRYIAYDICAANRVLNLLIEERGEAYDDRGALARQGTCHEALLATLEAIDYYSKPYPKSLANDFGTDYVYPMIQSYSISLEDRLCTYIHHMVLRIAAAVRELSEEIQTPDSTSALLVTGGGAHHDFLIELLRDALRPFHIQVDLPDSQTIDYKEAIVMAFIGILRLRESDNVLASVTGATRDSVGGGMWV